LASDNLAVTILLSPFRSDFVTFSSATGGSGSSSIRASVSSTIKASARARLRFSPSLTVFACVCLVLAAGNSAAAQSSRRWSIERTYANSPAGDFIGGEDPIVRQAAIEALGKFNGSVVVADTSNGRLLTVVNQKLAFASGYMPCSTIKLVVGLAALNEGIVSPGKKVWFEGYWFMTMVEGLAISNNVYFEHLGRELGFERFKRYANLFGFGEKAGWRIPGEQLGKFPEEEHGGGIARMTTFGDGISVNPLQLAAFVSAVANGGTLHYLQAPATPREAADLKAKERRRLPGGRWLPELRAGMTEAVKRGTGRKARTVGRPILGKTGTCSQYHRPGRTQLGWFASYNEGEGKRLAIVVLLRGGPMMFGPRAAEIAGNIYKTLSRQNYFSSDPADRQVVSLGLEHCCPL